MDNTEHDRRVVALLRSLDLAIGPLLRFDKATRHRVFLYFSHVKAPVRREVLAPLLKESGVDFRLRHVPLYAFKQHRIKKRGDRYTQRHQVGEEWELRLQIKSIIPKHASVPPEELEMGRGRVRLFWFSGPTFLEYVKKGGIDGADVAGALERALSLPKEVNECPPIPHTFFQGVNLTNSGASGRWSITSPTPSPTGRISSK